MRRREFISLLGGAAAWPPAARAQQASRVPWVGVLMARTENDRLLQAPIQSFRSRLQQLGWTEGHNLRIDYRWVPSYPNQSESSRLRVAATELVALQPGVILADGLHSALALQDQTRTIPIVYTSPVWKGLAHPFAPPDEQMTGFADSDYSKGGKLLSLLKGAAPNLTRVALIFGEYFVDDSLEPFLRIIEGVAPSYGLTPIRMLMPIESPDKERATIAAFADQANSGVILLWDSLLAIRRASILATAGYYHVPTITDALSCEDGTGLINYGPDAVEVYRGAASYVDRILKGAKPIDLPVQMPSKFSLRMNLRLARYMGLTIPASFVRTADEVWD